MLLPNAPDCRYHLIHMFQMLYHVRDMEETILNYMDKLVEGGLMVITIASKGTMSINYGDQCDKSKQNTSEYGFL